MSTPPTPPRSDGVLLRRARADDEDDLIRLVALDSARPLPGPALVAEVNGAIIAALCLTSGRSVADPFVPSLHLVELLRQYAARRHAPGAGPRRRRLLPRLTPRGSGALIGAQRSS